MTGASRRRLGAGVAVGVCLLALASGPGFLSDYNLVLAFTLFNYMSLAQAWNLVGGYGGLFSLGHAMFVGIGAYSAGLLLLHTGLPIGAAIVLAAAIAAVIGGLVAIPILRLRNVYFSVGTLGIALAVQAWFINWEYSGGTSGLNLPTETILSYDTLYYMAAGCLALTTLVVWGMVRGGFGLRLMAIRADEQTAREVGVRVVPVKLVAFTVSAFLVGLVGAIGALQSLYLEPYTAFGLSFTINMIIMSVIGGLGTIPGPLIGAFVVFELEQQLQDYPSWSILITGIALILIIRLAPGGLWGVIVRAWEWLLMRIGLHARAAGLAPDRVEGVRTALPEKERIIDA
jgi:branched-chain amino acid transport system permease protein